MQSEALRNIKTMRQVRTGHDLAAGRRARTTNSLSKSEAEAARLLSLNDRRAEQVLAKETQRFAAMEASFDKSRGRVLKAREKLAATINRNRALTELRHELQRLRWDKKDPVPPKKKPPTAKAPLPRVELKY
jgi:hypothetical protein